MKILHILATSDAMPHATGIIQGLQTQGFSQSVILPRDSKHYRDMEKDGLRLFPKILTLSPRMKAFFLRRLIAKEKYDIIHCWTARGAEWLGDTVLKSRKAPTVTGWFGSSADTDRFKACDWLVGSSRNGVARAQKETLSQKILFIPKPPDDVAQAPVDKVSLATARDAKTLLVFARSLPSKDINFLLKALDKTPHCVAWFAGSGVWRHELETQARRLNLIDRVRFLKQRKDCGALLRAADICLVPSRNDPFGARVFQAWATGTPVITFEKTEAAGLIAHQVTGILVPPCNADALADAFARTLYNEALRRTLIAQGYAAYIKNYTREAILLQWGGFFRMLKEEKQEAPVEDPISVRLPAAALVHIEEIQEDTAFLDRPSTGIFVPGSGKALRA